MSSFVGKQFFKREQNSANIWVVFGLQNGLNKGVIFMNMQAMLRQAQQMQKDMLKVKDEIDNTEFTGESSFVKVPVQWTNEVIKVEIDAESLDSDDIEALQDMIMVAINDAQKKIDSETEKKMGRFGNIPGLF